MPGPGSAATIPRDLSCIVKYESLEPDTSREPYPRGFNGNHFWVPPNRKNAYKRNRNTPAMIRWQGGWAEKVSMNEPMEVHSVATIFVQTETSHFLAVPFDAETQDVREHPGGWKVLSFDHEPQQGTSAIYSSINCDFAGDHPRLAAEGSRDWMPQLLPSIYNYDSVLALGQRAAVSAGLIGSLPLLFALPVFSASPQHFNRVMDRAGHLHPNRWHPHHHEHGRTQERGMVVTVYYDPRNANGSFQSRLEQLEEGVFGPFYQP
ncbi:MAG: hypothetical protein LQ352_007945 [Teloschistes flavicans]|nr:MAG: hypothetical protein LQ352_007945 [Teloschistes flavicans]